MYAVIGEPPSVGATQVIVTLVFEFTEVVGAAATFGGLDNCVTVISCERTTDE